MSGNININTDLASRVVTQNQYQYLDIVFQYWFNIKSHLKGMSTVNINIKRYILSSQDQTQYQDWIWSVNINIKTNIIDNILDFFKNLVVFQLLWRHCHLKGTHFMMGIWTQYLNVCYSISIFNIKTEQLLSQYQIQVQYLIKMLDNIKIQDSTLKLDQSRFEVNIKS